MQKELIESLLANISEDNHSDETGSIIQEVLMNKLAERLEAKKQEVMEGAFGAAVIGKSKLGTPEAGAKLDAAKKALNMPDMPSTSTVRSTDKDGNTIVTRTKHVPGKDPEIHKWKDRAWINQFVSNKIKTT